MNKKITVNRNIIVFICRKSNIHLTVLISATNINDALLTGVRFLLRLRDADHVPLVFFLTDGQPTTGVKNPGTIADNVQRVNENIASVFGLAFGQGADYELIKVVAVQNAGFARRIYEAADASEQVKGIQDVHEHQMA